MFYAKYEGRAFANFGNSSGTEKACCAKKKFEKKRKRKKIAITEDLPNVTFFKIDIITLFLFFSR